MAIMSFKVTDFGTTRKPTRDFLLVINTNLSVLQSCTVYMLWLIICQIFASNRRSLHFIALAGSDPLRIYG